MNNYNQKTVRILTILVIILLVANIASLSVIWFNYPNRTEKDEMRPERARVNKREMMMMKHLDMDTMQVQSYKSAQRELRKNLRQYRCTMENNRKRIHEQLFSENPDTNLINTLNDSIGLMTIEMEKLKINHFLQMKKTLTNEQIQKFREMFEDDDHEKMRHEDERHEEEHSRFEEHRK
jgi:hypothetical protein